MADTDSSKTSASNAPTAASEDRAQLVAQLYSRAGQAEEVREYRDALTGAIVRLRPSEHALLEHDRRSGPGRAIQAAELPESTNKAKAKTDDEPDTDIPSEPRSGTWQIRAVAGGVGIAAGCALVLGVQQLLPAAAPTGQLQGEQDAAGYTYEEFNQLHNGTQLGESPVEAGEPAARPDPLSISTGIPLPRLGSLFREETVAFLQANGGAGAVQILSATDTSGRVCLVAVDSQEPLETDSDGASVSLSTSSCAIPSMFPPDGLALDVSTRVPASMFVGVDFGTEPIVVVTRIRWTPDGAVSSEGSLPDIELPGS